MKVTGVRAIASSQPRQAPIRDALQTLDTAGECRVEIKTSEGVCGTSSIYFGRLSHGPSVLASLINSELGPAIVGEDAFMIRGIRDRLWRLTDYVGTIGLALQGIAAIDIALWDAVGKAMEQPVWRLLGACRDKVPAYAMVGWLNYSVDQLKRVSTQAMEQGFKGVKIKVGAETLAEDVGRIEAVRDVVGHGGLIMVDANQVFLENDALQRGLVYQELGCTWFEEPLRADDSDGLARLAQKPGDTHCIRGEQLRQTPVSPTLDPKRRRYCPA